MIAHPLIASPVEISDEEIVRRIVAGERELFELLLRRYNQRVFRAVRAVLRTPDDAEDVMQQAYVSAYRHLHQFEGRSSFATWLTRIALREATARNRKNLSHLHVVPELGGENSMNDFPEPGPDPEARAVTGNLCRCGAYPNILKAGRLAADLQAQATSQTP